MRARDRGGIVNVSSVAGFVAMGSYSAIKAWVTTFSEGLAIELAPHGVVVTAVCPGFTHTQFHDRAEMNMSRLPEAAWLDASEVVEIALADAARGRSVSVPGWQYKTLVAALQVIPRGLVSRISSEIASRRRTR